MVLPGENPNNGKIIGCIAASLAIQVLLAKMDELALRKTVPDKAMAAVLKDFEAQQAQKKQDKKSVMQ